MSEDKTQDRKKRIRVLKLLLSFGIMAAVLLPSVLGIYLGAEIRSLEAEVVRLQETFAEMEEADAGEEPLSQAPAKAEEPQGEMLTEEDSIRYWEDQEKEEADTGQPQAQSGIRKVYLTFDDGPSMYTDEILDILKAYNVKATFFVVGKGKKPYEDSYRRIREEGHTLGMHSYSHAYREIYSSKEAFIKDVNQLQDYLHEVTGEWPDVYRFPGGSSNRVSTVDMEELEQYLEEIGLTWYDWNISSGDATGHLSKEQIIQNCTAKLDRYGEAVILLHDAADKRTTVEALPEIIEQILSMEDTVIVPITADTQPVQHGNTK